MNTLREILDRLSDKEAEAALNPEDASPKVRAGVEALARNAKVDVERIAKEYKDAVMGSVVIIGVKGATAQEFATAAEKAGSIAINFTAVNDRLVKALKARGVGELYTSTAHFMLIDELSKLRLEYDMVQLPTPQVNAYSDGIYDAPLAIAIEKLLRKNYGTGLQSAVTRREIGARALQARFSGKKLPVVVYNLEEDVNVSFIPAPLTVVKSDKKVSDNIVKKQLSTIKAMLSSKPKQNDAQQMGSQEEA